MYNRDKIINTMREIYEGSKVIAPYVVIAQPRRIEGEVPAQNFDGYDNLHVDLLGISHGFCNIFGEKVDVARNYLIEQALESGAKYLFFIGEDTVVPFDAFKTLHKTAEENPNSVVTGVYYIKLSDAMIMVREGNWIKIPNVDPGQIIEAWQTGMDCMLIPIELLRKMKEQDPEIPFCCIGNQIGDLPFIGEDNFFVHRVHKMGIKLLVNTDVQCLHMDIATGNYTAHPDIDVRKYFTNIPIGRPLVLEDKEYIDNRWLSRLPEGSGVKKTNEIVAKLIEQNVPIKFDMGSASDRLDGYLAVDKFHPNADIKEDVFDLRLPDDCADEIRASHILEHLPYHRVPELLRKWCKALKPETGKLVIEVPNLEEQCRQFVEADDQTRFMLSVCIFGAAITNPTPEQLKAGTESPHIWGYYPRVMETLLKDSGFKEVKILPNQGGHPGPNFRAEATK